ncbi:MFS transporter, partial [Candidatus Parvarchaeota archaeon]|nr:MFS transporter [Candidatus Parvarchaeota archaeon]
MKRVLAANFLDAFAISATGMILPLLLLHRNMELGMVGAIISSLPLIYTVLRTALASVAESFGYKAYFVLSSACCAVSPIIYMLSSSPAGFLAGRAVDSLKQASIWAVNRNAVMADTPPTDFARATSRLVSIRYAAIALGAVGGGYILNTLGFDYSFLFLSAVGAAGLYVAIGMRQHRAGIGGLDFGKIRDSFNLFGRGKLFTLTTIVMLFEASMDGLINLFVIPVFLKSIGLDYTSIGL